MNSVHFEIIVPLTDSFVNRIGADELHLDERLVMWYHSVKTQIGGDFVPKANTACYSTGQIAKIAGLHPNTVRMYEEWGLIHKPERKKNGYRVYNDIHIKQFELARKALQIEVLQAGLRKRMIEAVKLSAMYQFEAAAAQAEEYIRIARRETENAKEAAAICEALCRQPQDDGIVYKRSQAAKELGLTIDTIRNWEMNGLLTVKRKQNGYRVYDSNDINRLKIIRSLRCANYSLSAILRMLEAYDSGMDKDNILDILNTPDEDDDIVSACDRLIVSLENAVNNAYEVIAIIAQMQRMYEELGL
ncbi:MAG: MerR family transcriptional regulator [Oscillospiraceae bacterium]